MIRKPVEFSPSISKDADSSVQGLARGFELNEISRQDSDRKLWGRRFMIMWGWLFLLLFTIILTGFSPEKEILNSILPALIFSGISSLLLSFFLIAPLAVIVRWRQSRIGPQEKFAAAVFIMGALLFVPMAIYWDWAYIALIAFMALFYRILALLARQGRFFGENISSEK
ncbi:MAG: hypothetical protein IIB00_01530 [candidate division Zixibacteria bacterium]|nr:hypothetical protein [candidate division Zixibacteria bacterium]